MNNNPALGTSIFGNSNGPSANNLFGQNKGTNPPAANSNSSTSFFGGNSSANLFGGNSSSTSSPPTNATSLFGANNGALTNPPPATGNLFNGGAGNNNKQTAKTGFGLSGAPNNNNPVTSLFGGGAIASNPTGSPNTAGSVAGTPTNPVGITSTNPLNVANGANSTSIFGNNPSTGSNSLGGIGSNTLGNAAKETTANTANLFGNSANTGGTSAFGGAPTAPNQVSSPSPAPTGTTTAPFFGTNTTAPTTSFGGLAKPAETANTAPSTAPATNLFNNPQPSTAPTAATGATNPSPSPLGNLFSQIPSKPATGGSLTGQPLASNNANTSTNPIAGSPPIVGAFPPANPTLSAPQNTLQADFQSSNQSVDEYLNEYRTTLLKSYEDIKKMAENSLKLLQQREQNQRIVSNFKEIETQLLKEGKIQKKLQDLERKQEEIAFQIEVMSRKVGQGLYTHELSEHLQEYGELKKMITQMEDEEVERNDSGHEQLLNIFYSLNQVEMQIREMSQIADVYLKLA